MPLSLLVRSAARTALRLSPAALALAIAACADPSTHLTAPDPAALAHAPTTTIATMSSVSVVMTGLDAPRGLAFGPEGALYVAEAGEATYDPAACVPVYRGRNCYSGTGAVSRWWKGQQERVASGLPSHFNPDVNDISGPQDIGFLGRGHAIVSIGWGASPDARDAMAALVPAGRAFGTLIQLTPGGPWQHHADIAAFERNNAGGGLEDSNPYGVLVEPGHTFVTDAGGNTLVRVAANGNTSLVATFPATPLPPGLPFPMPVYEAVPTEVKRGPDGALWVSTLSGAPFLPGTAAIWRVTPGAAPAKILGGLTMVPDFDIAPDGTVWVTRYASAPFFGGPSAIDRIAPDGTRTTFLLGAVEQPTGIVVGPDGAIYISNRGSQANVGEVLRLVP